MKLKLTALIFALIAALAGCDGDEVTTDTLPEPPSPEAECIDVEPADAQVAALVDVCSTADGTSVRIENVSSTDVTIRPIRMSPTFTSEDVPSPNSLSRIAALQAAPAGADAAGNYQLPAGHKVLAETQNPPVVVEVGVAFQQTFHANFARALTGLLERQLMSPGRALANRVANCAQSTGDVLRAPSALEDAVRVALTEYAVCGNLIRDFLRQAPDNPTVTRQVYGFARSIENGAWIDALTFVAAKFRGLR